MESQERRGTQASDQPKCDKRELAFLAAMVVLLLLVNVTSLWHKSATIDEPDHLRYGYSALATGDFTRSQRFDNSKMPLTALNAVPRVLADTLPGGAESGSWRALRSLKAARFITACFAALLLCFVYRWSRELYGREGAMLTALLYLLSPSLLAHSRLVTTDLYQAGTALIALYYFWRFTQRRSWTHACISALALGVCLLSKYSSLSLIPIMLLLLLLSSAHALVLAPRSERSALLRGGVREFATFLPLYIVLVLVVVNAGFLFQGSGTLWGAHHLKSGQLRALQENTAWLSAVPVPLPVPYLQGLDWILADAGTGASFGKLYLLGELRYARGFPSYYALAFVYKVPLATQLLILLALALYVRHIRRFDFWRNESFLWVPVLFFGIQLSFFFDAQIGFRYFLVALPLLHVFCGSLACAARSPGVTSLSRSRLGVAVGLLLLVQLVSVASYFPHYLSYFNELVWDRTRAYKILADSNLDWAQNRLYLADYLQDHPDAIVAPSRPTAGQIIVSVNELVGVLGDDREYLWLRKNFEPVAHIAHSYLVYEIREEQLDALRRGSSDETSH